MIGRSGAILAIAVSDGAFTCAEVSPKGEAHATKGGVFTFPAGVKLEHAEPLGQALRGFLKGEGFTATQAVVGLPAKWVIAQERELPPASAAEALDVLRLQAEKLTASDAAEMAFDFVGTLVADRPNRVLMIGTLRKRLDQLTAALTAAGLRVRAITPTALTLPGVTGEGEALVMMIGGGGAELVWQRDGWPRAIQHVPLAMNGHGRSMSLLGAEVKRNGLLDGRGGGAAMLDAVGLTPHERSRLAESIGTSVALHATAPPHASDARLGPAVALGTAATGDKLLVDFTHSRLAPVEKRKFGRATWWAAALAAVVVIVVAMELLTYRADTAELAALDEALARQAPDVADAEAAIARTGFGRGFYDGRPAALACLAELTAGFGERDAVWTTGVSFRQDGKGQLLGAGADQPSVLALLDRIKANRAFRDVTLVDLREATNAREREVTFTITFTFVPPNTVAASAVATAPTTNPDASPKNEEATR